MSVEHGSRAPAPLVTAAPSKAGMRRPRGARLREVIPTEEAVKRALAPLAAHGRAHGIELLCEITDGVGALVLGNERALVDTLVRTVGRAMAAPESREVRVRLARQSAGFAPSDCVLVTVTSGSSSSDLTHLELVLPSSALDGGRGVARGARILVVTPSVEGARILIGGVRAAGALAASVRDVPTAHERLRAACREGAGFNLVYVDDGLAETTIPFLRSLRDDPTLGRALALVATALPHGSREHFQDEGASAVLVKPVLPRELVGAMARVLLVGSASESVRPRANTERLRVLVAGNDPVSALVARRALERLGHDVVEVSTGQRVLEAIAREPFDVVLLDLTRTDDGFGVARTLRAGCADGESTTMVVALAGADLDDATCERAGIHAVLEKPVSQERLAAVLARCVTHAPASSERLVRAKPASSGPQEVLDLADLLARTDDEALLTELFQDFLRHGQRWSETLQSTAEAGAFRDLASLAQRLRGALVALGAHRAGIAAADVETHSLALACGSACDDTRANLARALRDLSGDLDELRSAMRDYLGMSHAE